MSVHFEIAVSNLISHKQESNNNVLLNFILAAWKLKPNLLECSVQFHKMTGTIKPKKKKKTVLNNEKQNQSHHVCVT